MAILGYSVWANSYTRSLKYTNVCVSHSVLSFSFSFSPFFLLSPVHTCLPNSQMWQAVSGVLLTDSIKGHPVSGSEEWKEKERERKRERENWKMPSSLTQSEVSCILSFLPGSSLNANLNLKRKKKFVSVRSSVFSMAGHLYVMAGSAPVYLHWMRGAKNWLSEWLNELK